MRALKTKVWCLTVLGLCTVSGFGESPSRSTGGVSDRVPARSNGYVIPYRKERVESWAGRKIRDALKISDRASVSISIDYNSEVATTPELNPLKELAFLFDPNTDIAFLTKDEFKKEIATELKQDFAISLRGMGEHGIAIMIDAVRRIALFIDPCAID